MVDSNLGLRFIIFVTLSPILPISSLCFPGENWFSKYEIPTEEVHWSQLHKERFFLFKDECLDHWYSGFQEQEHPSIDMNNWNMTMYFWEKNTYAGFYDCSHVQCTRHCLHPTLRQSQQHSLLRLRISIHSFAQSLTIFIEHSLSARHCSRCCWHLVNKTGKHGSWPLGVHIPVGGTDSKPTNIDERYKENYIKRNSSPTPMKPLQHRYISSHSHSTFPSWK